MATVVMAGDADVLPRRRRPLTYERNLHRRSHDLDAFDAITGPDFAHRSRLAKPSLTVFPPKASRRAISDNIDVFDIPSSEDENSTDLVNANPPIERRKKLEKQLSFAAVANTPISDVFDVPKDVTPSTKNRSSIQRSAKESTISVIKPKAPPSARRHLSQQRINGIGNDVFPSTSSPQSKKRKTSTSPDRPRSRSTSHAALDIGDSHSRPTNWDSAGRTRAKRDSRILRTSEDDHILGRARFSDKGGTCKRIVSEPVIIRRCIANTKSTPTDLRAWGETRVEPLQAHGVSKPVMRTLHTPEKSRRSRSQTNASTPSRQEKSPSCGNAKVTPTLKQASLWNSLLIHHLGDSRDATTSPAVVPQPSFTTHNSLSHARSRKRLIDTLGVSATETWSSDEEHNEEDLAVIEIQDEVDDTHRGVVSGPNSPSTSQTLPSNRPQSKLTYAGQRSYLHAAVTGIEDLLKQPLDCGTASTTVNRLRQNGHSIKQGQACMLVEESEEEDGANAMRTIHELRASGDSIRFENDLFLDDLQVNGKSSLSRKRSALLEICQRLYDTEFRDRFAQYGLELRVMVPCQSEDDLVVGMTIATILSYTLALSSSMHTAVQLYEAGTVGFLIRLLRSQRDIVSIARDRVANMSKIAQNSILDFKNKLLQSPLWSEGLCGAKLSPMLAALKCLDLLVQRLRKDKIDDVILTKEMLDELLRILKFALKDAHSKQHETSEEGVSLVKLVLSVLESLTIVDSCASSSELWSSRTLNELVDGLDSVMDLSKLHVERFSSLVLRICLNLANNNENNSRSFATPQFMDKLMSAVTRGFRSLQDPEHNSGALRDFDNLLLALAAMFNLAEWSDAARLVTLHDCQEKLDGLLEIFTGSRAQASEAESLAASSINVAYGYLAVLLGHLCQNEQVRDHVRSRLPKGSLSLLSTAVEEFIVHHKEADKGRESNENWVAFTRRLARVAESLDGISPTD